MKTYPSVALELTAAERIRRRRELKNAGYAEGVAEAESIMERAGLSALRAAARRYEIRAQATGDVRTAGRAEGCADVLRWNEDARSKLMDVLIQYDYPGTVNDEPVGKVYVTGPHFSSRSGIFSHTYKVADAAVWNPIVAEQQIRRRHWPNARTVAIEEAEDLR